MSVVTHTFVGLKCLTETKIKILCDHVDHAHFYIVEMGCQMVKLLSAHIVRPTMFVNLTPAHKNDATQLRIPITSSFTPLPSITIIRVDQNTASALLESPVRTAMHGKFRVSCVISAELN